MKKTKFVLGILLFGIGLLCIFTPFYMEWQQNKEVKAIEEALALISDPEAGANKSLSSVENLNFSKEQLADVLELEIPSIKLKQYVLGETTEQNLNIALTQIKEAQTPGAGNFTIAGHRGYRDGRHFSNLDKVEAGEEIYLHTQNTTYIYRIESTQVIEDHDVYVLEDTKGKNEITLITCTPSGKKRIAVKGELAAVENEG